MVNPMWTPSIQPFEFLYDPALTIGRIDYTKETAEISFKAKILGTAGLKIIYNLDQGLEKTGRSREWGISMSSIYRAIPTRYEINAALIHKEGETIEQTTGRF
ncbi:MAG: hypothetical protein LBU25_02650 [Treponema sp.]|jgi:hypothetical protein|nr:hypothetical protein [Treponema sp.]